jgi:hypothetical protein
MPPNTKEWKITLTRFQREGLLPRGEPRQGYDNDNSVNRDRRHSPRVGRGRGDDRQVDRADDRDQEDRPDREDDE